MMEQSSTSTREGEGEKSDVSSENTSIVGVTDNFVITEDNQIDDSLSSSQDKEVCVSSCFKLDDLDHLGISCGKFIPVKIDESYFLKGEKMESKLANYPVISTDDAIQALWQFSKTSCWYNHACMDTLRIINDEMIYCYKIELESVLESRFVYLDTSHPYDTNIEAAGEPFIRPWECSIDPISNETKISNAVRVTACSHCNSCDQACSNCNGTGKCFQYIKAKAELVQHNTVTILNRSKISDSVLSSLQGRLLYELEGNHILPASIFMDVELNNSIQSTIKKVDLFAKSKRCCIRNQRLFISIIPVRQLQCISGTEEFSVIVYNYDKKVMCTNFPTKFSCFKKLFSKKRIVV